MPKLFLHIGHPKTGTSALQNFFAKNEKFLQKNSIIYPTTAEAKQAAKFGKITSGNGQSLIRILSKIKTQHPENLLFSSEFLFQNLVDDDFRQILFSHAERIGLEVEIICYTRDFFEYSFSKWGQSIKRGQGTLGYVDFTLADNVDKRGGCNQNLYILKNILSLANEENFTVNVFNYDRHKIDIFSHFCTQVLSLDNNLYATSSEIHAVNRSLTLAEYEVQRLFNLYYPGKSSAFVSDALVENLPEVQSEIPPFSQLEYQSIVDKYAPIINEVNTFLNGKENIKLTAYEELRKRFTAHSHETFTLTSTQLEVLIEHISSELISAHSISLKNFIQNRLKQKFSRPKKKN